MIPSPFYRMEAEETFAEDKLVMQSDWEKTLKEMRLIEGFDRVVAEGPITLQILSLLFEVAWLAGGAQVLRQVNKRLGVTLKEI